MKNFTLAILFSAILFSCSDDHELSPIKTVTEISKSSNIDAQKQFANLLSKAIYERKELRSFLKEEALDLFDNDYDIFYPFVKNKIVTGDETFRDILLSYSESEANLIAIEESLLFLNILVPNLSWISDFRAENWDINDPDVAIICRDDDDNNIYENGEIIGQIGLGEIPDFPCLVIKNNERLKLQNNVTRSSEANYEFKHDVFKKQPQTRHFEFDVFLETEDPDGQYLKASELSPEIIYAWQQSKIIPNGCDRDYIYYGLDINNKKGRLNRNVRESLYKFRINPSIYYRIADQTGDPQLREISQLKRYLTNEEVLKKIWTDGSFEIYIRSYIMVENSTTPLEKILPFSISPNDLFYIEKAHVKHRNSTYFGRHSKNTYSVDVKDLKGKWYKPSEKDKRSVFLNPWDISSQSMQIFLHIEEFDNAETYQKKIIVSGSKTNKLDFTADSDKTSDVKLKTTYGFSSTSAVTTDVIVSTTHGSDELGNISFFFDDPIILNDTYKDTKGYKINTVYNGSIEMMLLPEKLR